MPPGKPAPSRFQVVARDEATTRLAGATISYAQSRPPGAARRLLTRGLKAWRWAGAGKRRNWQTGISALPQRHAKRSPAYRDRLTGPKLVGVIELPVLRAVFVDQAGDFDVVAAILGNLDEPPLLEPAQRLEAVGRLAQSHRAMSDGIQGEPMRNRAPQLGHEIERRQLAQVEHRVAVEHFVVEPQVIEPHDEVRAAQLFHQRVHAV